MYKLKVRDILQMCSLPCINIKFLYSTYTNKTPIFNWTIGDKKTTHLMYNGSNPTYFKYLFY